MCTCVGNEGVGRLECRFGFGAQPPAAPSSSSCSRKLKLKLPVGLAAPSVGSPAPWEALSAVSLERRRQRPVPQSAPSVERPVQQALPLAEAPVLAAAVAAQLVHPAPVVERQAVGLEVPAPAQPVLRAVVVVEQQAVAPEILAPPAAATPGPAAARETVAEPVVAQPLPQRQTPPVARGARSLPPTSAAQYRWACRAVPRYPGLDRTVPMTGARVSGRRFPAPSRHGKHRRSVAIRWKRCTSVQTSTRAKPIA